MISNHCKAVEEYGNEIREDMILEMIKKGLSLEMIAEIAKLPVEKLRQLQKR